MQIETSKGQIEYSLLGHGKPILIIVGGHTNCKETIFHKGLDPNKFCFVIPSRPGYGLTPKDLDQDLDQEKIQNSKLVTFNNRWGHMLWFGREYDAVLNELILNLC